MIELNSPVPDFSLQDLLGNPHQISDFRGQFVVLNFWSAECPWSERADQELAKLKDEWGERVQLLYIAPNANESKEMIASAAQARQIPTSQLLLDPEQKIADLFDAQTTPHFFVIDPKGTLVYRGGLDDATFRQRTPTQQYLKNAMAALLAKKKPPIAETTPYGCAIVRYAP